MLAPRFPRQKGGGRPMMKTKRSSIAAAYAPTESLSFLTYPTNSCGLPCTAGSNDCHSDRCYNKCAEGLRLPRLVLLNTPTNTGHYLSRGKGNPG